MRDRRTLLVTGGAGFIGSHFVCMHLDQFPDDRIIVLDALTYAASVDRLPLEERDPDRLEFVHGNIRSPLVIDSLVARADVVVHLAAETHAQRSISDSAIFVETDVLGTQTIANAVVRHRDSVDRFIHVSSSEVYGSARSEPMDEEHPLNPSTPYAAAKCGADRLVYACTLTHELPAVILRPFNNYGPGQHLEKLVPRLITSAVLNERLTVHGRGTAARDWIHVEDTCRGLEAVIAAPRAKVCGEVFNLGSSRATDALTMAHKVVELSDGDPSLIQHTEDRPGQVARQRAGIDKAAKQLDWRPQIRLDHGLRSTIEWYWTHRAWWDRMRWMRSVPVTGSDGRVTYW